MNPYFNSGQLGILVILTRIAALEPGAEIGSVGHAGRSESRTLLMLDASMNGERVLIQCNVGSGNLLRMSFRPLCRTLYTRSLAL